MRRDGSLCGLRWGLPLLWVILVLPGCTDKSSPGTTGEIAGVATLQGRTDHRGILITLDESGATATTGADGRYLVSGVQPGSYVVTASRPGWVPASAGASVSVSAGEVSVAEELELVPVEGGVTGIARLEGETDHTGVIVRLSGGDQETQTDATGAFAFAGVVPGSYVVTAEAANYASASSAPFVVEEDGEPVDVGELVLAVGRGSLEGVATLEGETDHAATLVTLQGTSHSTLTGPTGRYAFTSVAVGQYTVEASHPGWASATATDQTVAMNAVTSVPSLELASNPGEVNGQVTLAGQAAHAGIQISLDGAGMDSVTDASGFYTVSAVPAGTYTVTASYPGFEADTTPAFTVDGGATVSAPTLELQAERGALTGTVELSGETDHGGVLVEVVGTAHATVSNSAGLWSMSGIAAGTYEVRASKPTFATASAPSVTVLANQTVTVPILQLGTNPGEVTGQVTREGAANHSGIAVQLDGSSLNAVSDASGFYSISGVPAGTYTVTASYPDYDSESSAMFAVAPGQTATAPSLVLTVSRGELTGTVALAGETSHSGVLVEVVGTGRATLSDAAGQWTVSSIPVGTYEVRASKTDFVTTSEPAVTVLGNQTVTVPLIQLGANPGTFTGVVYKAGATDHSGILVTVQGTSHVGGTTSDGTFVITGVPSGVYSISAEAQGYQPHEYGVYPVAPGQTVTLPTETLPKQQGRVRGAVLLEGMPYQSDALLELLGSSESIHANPDGTWEMLVPVGNYNGVRASAPHYQPEEHVATVTVTETGIAYIPAFFLTAENNNVNGQVTLHQQVDHQGITVELFGVLGEVTEGAHLALTTPDTTGSFTFTDVPLGPYHVRYSHGSGWSTITRYVDVTPGLEIDLAPETLKTLFVYINGDAAWTNSPNVTLTMGADDCLHMRIGNQADLSAVPWESCAGARPWTLSGPAGTNRVYAQFRDSNLVETLVVYDEIWLDHDARILSVTEDTGGATRGRFDTIHLRLDAGGEAGGTAWVDIGATYDLGVALYDDGTNGDATPNDGVYERDYTITQAEDLVSGVVTGYFTDSYTNDATPVTAPGTVTIAIAPAIFNVQVVADSVSRTCTISWQTDELASGALHWGPSNMPYDYTESDPAHTSTKSFTIGSGTLSLSTPYHFRLQATDVNGNVTYTVDRVFYLRPNPPEMVIAMPGVSRFDVRWEAPPQSNVVGYNVYRAQTSGGPYTKLNASPHTHDALAYHDLTVGNGQAYFYVITAVDDYDNESEYSVEVGGIPNVNTGPTYVNGVLAGNQVWTSRGSPYVVTGDTLAQAGHYLALAPGTRVEFDGDHYLRLEGHVYAIGDETHAVTFTSHAQTPLIGDWNTLILKDSPDGRFDRNASRYLGGNVLYRTRIEYAEVRGLHVDQSSVSILHCDIRRNGGGTMGGGMRFTYSSVLVADSTVVDNLFYICGNRCGVAITAEESELTMTRTEILDNVAQQLSSNGSIGVYLSGGDAVVRDCLIAGNQGETGTVRWEMSGALTAADNATLVVVNSTFANNGIENTYSSGAPPSTSAGALLVLDALADVHQCRFENNYLVRFEDSAAGFHAGGTMPGTWPIGARLIGADFSDNQISDSNGGCSTSIGGEDTTVYGCRTRQSPLASDPDIRLVNGSVDGNLVEGMTTGSLIVLLGAGMSKNSLDDPVATYLLEYLGASDFGSQQNYWGPATTAEMVTGGDATDISTIYDFYENFNLGRVIYSNWAPSAYPLVRISSPEWGLHYRQGEPIELSGYAVDTEDGTLLPGALTWSSSQDGVLGTGDSLSLSTLSQGAHSITLTATDSHGQQGTLWVEIVIDP